MSLAETAQAAELFLSDGLIITGTATGSPAKPTDVQGEHKTDIQPDTDIMASWTTVPVAILFLYRQARAFEVIWPRRAWRLSWRWPDGGLSVGYGHDGSDVCLGDGQTEAYL